MAKEVSASVEALDARRVKDAADRQTAIDIAAAELREAEKLTFEARAKLGRLQNEQMDASFAYDAERRALEAKVAKAA